MSLPKEAIQIKEQYKQSILKLPNVVGVGVGYRISAKKMTGEISIMVLVRRKIPKAGLSAEALAPREVGGIRTDVLEVGDIRALLTRTDRWRPAKGGISLGHYKISAGTFGAVVHDKDTKARLILSNNHVLANMNSANVGDPILQPGAVDGGSVENDTIARLERFCRIDFGNEPASCDLANAFVQGVNIFASLIGSSHQIDAYRVHESAVNLVDAAVARPVDDGEILEDILDIGVVDSVQSPDLGMAVRKSGRSTGLTQGEITVLHATVTVSYGSGLSATFEDQIVTSPISQGGDSGSLLVASSANKAVGLLFAGSDESTIHNPISNVLDCLNVDFSSNWDSNNVDKQLPIERVEAVKNAYQAELMSKSNVVGVGVGLRQTGGETSNDVALVVMVSKKIPKAQLAPEDIIPSELDGVPVDVKEIGKIEAQ